MLRRRNLLQETENKKKKGQSTLEYILIIAAVIGVLVFFLGPNSLFYQKLNSTLQSGTNSMDKMAKRLANSYPDSIPGGAGGEEDSE